MVFFLNQCVIEISVSEWTVYFILYFGLDKRVVTLNAKDIIIKKS